MRFQVLKTASDRTDNGGSKHLLNVGQFLRDYTAQHPRRESSSYSPPWQPEILLSELLWGGYSTLRAKIRSPSNQESQATHSSPDDGGSKHPWNVGQFLLDYTAQHPIRRLCPLQASRCYKLIISTHAVAIFRIKIWHQFLCISPSSIDFSVQLFVINNHILHKLRKAKTVIKTIFWN
jgi:hypothetical protein